MTSDTLALTSMRVYLPAPGPQSFVRQTSQVSKYSGILASSGPAVIEEHKQITADDISNGD